MPDLQTLTEQSVALFNDAASKVASFWNSASLGAKIGLVSGGFVSWLLVRHAYIGFQRRRKNLAPGPIGLPVIGIAFLFGNGFIDAFINKLPKYGDAVYYNFGASRNLMITDPDLAVHTFKRKDLDTTVHTFDKGTVWNESSKARNHFGINFRLVQSIRALLGENALNSKFIKQGIERGLHLMVFPQIDKSIEEGKSIDDLGSLVKPMTLSLMMFAVFGLNLKDLDDPFYDEYTKVSSHLFTHILNKLIELQQKGPNSEGNYAVDRDANNPDDPFIPVVRLVSQYMQDNIENIKDAPNSLYNRLLPRYANDDKNEATNVSNIDWDMAAMIGAAQDATAVAFEFLILCLARYQSIQKRIYDELRASKVVIDSNESEQSEKFVIDEKELFACVKSRDKCGVFKAFINEVLRRYPPTIVANGRKAVNSFEMEIKRPYERKVNVEQYTNYLINVGACNLNERYWKKNESDINGFCIDNFLDEEGKFVSNKNKLLMTFGAGPRSCPGRYLAYRLLQITLTFVIAKYEVKMELKPGVKLDAVKIEMDFKNGLTYAKCDCPVKFLSRRK